jgi:hypothetical protein
VDSFYSAVFLLLEGHADSIRAGLGMVRSDCDLIGGTVCVARMVNAVLNVTLDTLVMLATVLIIHFIPPFARNSAIIIAREQGDNSKIQILICRDVNNQK